nr:hypothetical protein BCU25_18175 [Vibrio cyclitrophicus]
MSVYKNDTPSHLNEAIESILNQTLSSYDLLIYVDGPIGNDVRDILDTYRSKNNILIYFGSVNLGLAYALNFLINKVKDSKKYDYIARMDSDDISLPNRFEVQVNHMSMNTDIDVLGSYCEEFGSDLGKKIKDVPIEHEELYCYSILRCPFIHPTVMFRLSSIMDDLVYPENKKFTEDMALWFKLMLYNYRFENIPVVLLKYRMVDDTVERRLGLDKAISEFSLRLEYMFKLKKFSLRNFAGVSARLVFHLLPVKLARYFYLKFR